MVGGSFPSVFVSHLPEGICISSSFRPPLYPTGFLAAQPSELIPKNDSAETFGVSECDSLHPQRPGSYPEGSTSLLMPSILWMGQRNPNHQLIGGKHPTIYRVSTIQGGAGFLPSTVCTKYRTLFVISNLTNHRIASSTLISSRS